MTVMSGRALTEVPRDQAMELLASVSVGRLVFTHQALPAIRPVNHVVDGGEVVIGLTPGSAIGASATGDGTVVAYEADELDSVQRSGWSVIVVGIARLDTDEASITRRRALLQPWLSGASADVVAISAEIVTAYRLLPEAAG